MPPVARKQAAPPPVQEGAPFGDLSFYSGGFNLPEGDWALFFGVRVHAYTKQDGNKGQEMLGVMVTAYPLAGGEAHEQFLSMGKNALKAWAPHPDKPAHDGIGSTGIVPIQGANAVSLAGLTNWNLFLDSLYTCGLPKGVFINDCSVLDGIWVHTQNVPEPESRKQLGSNTGEVQQQQRAPGLIPIVTEIKEDGKPWEGTGGLPEGVEAAAAPEPAKPVAKAAVAKPGPKAVPAAKPKAAAKPAPAAETAEVGEEEVAAAALEAATNVLSQTANGSGMLKLQLRVQAFNDVKKRHGDEMAQSVIETIFNDDGALNGILGQLGYEVKGAQVAVK